MGPAFSDVSEITTVDGRDILVRLNRRSTFVPEALEILVEEPNEPAVGTGPFSLVSSSSNGLEMAANQQYYLGAPRIERIIFKPYASMRAAWADMMRGQVDVLFDVAPDALELLRPSLNVHVFEFRERYTYAILLNMRRPLFKDKRLRAALNRAIDRDKLIADVFQGHGVPAVGPVWPEHWAYDRNLPIFDHDARTAGRALVASNGNQGEQQDEPGNIRFTCLFADASQERLALSVQQQLRAFGVEMHPEFLSIDDFQQRLTSGNFDAVLLNALVGPNLLRVYQWWHSGATYNFGGYRSDAADAGLDAIRHAADDAAYKAGVGVFQKAIIDDPPAIFLTWSERARAVSNRFDVIPDSSGDVLKTLRLWRPVTSEMKAGRN